MGHGDWHMVNRLTCNQCETFQTLTSFDSLTVNRWIMDPSNCGRHNLPKPCAKPRRVSISVIGEHSSTFDNLTTQYWKTIYRQYLAPLNVSNRAIRNLTTSIVILHDFGPINSSNLNVKRQQSDYSYHGPLNQQTTIANLSTAYLVHSHPTFYLQITLNAILATE